MGRSGLWELDFVMDLRLRNNEPVAGVLMKLSYDWPVFF